MSKLKIYFLGIAAAGALYLGSAQVSFGQVISTNGQFTSFSNIPATDTGNGGGLTIAGTYTGDTLTGWTNTSYAFVFRSPNLGATSITGSGGAFSLWDTPNGGPDTITAPPNGGNFIADDGAYQVGPITQVINGLTNGKKYDVSFEWAGAQQFGAAYTSATKESWSVALGNATGVYTQGSGDTSGTLAGGQTTTQVSNIAHGFTGWQSTTFTFTANATTDTLYFFANGTPTGQPPFALLADVNVFVPEPGTTAAWFILFAMLIMFGNRAWRRRQKSLSTNV